MPNTYSTAFDIGGVNTKVARLGQDGSLGALTRPFPIEHRLPELTALLRELKSEVGSSDDDRYAVTMTAELSQLFRTKREGVERILAAVGEALGPEAQVFAVDGRFLSIPAAVREPLAVAASNWAATARFVASVHPDALLVDIGSTTTDLIPIVGGKVVTAGTNDPARLASGELVYSGVIRTPVEAIVRTVPWRGAPTGVSAEGFALSGDVYLWLGRIPSEDYTVPAPDGRPATRPFAGERLARVICGDREILSDADIDGIARAVEQAQTGQVSQTIKKVVARHPSMRHAVVTGQGEFLATLAAEQAGLEIIRLSDRLGKDGGRAAPAAALAMLLAGASVNGTGRAMVSPPARRSVRTTRLAVIKVGGGLSAIPGALDRIGKTLAELARSVPLVVFPGGGPFADAVREFDAAVGLSPSAAHWMAILGMDQYALALAGHIPGGKVIEEAQQIAPVLARGGVPVLAPARWLRSADELPHTWSVTSDSLAAYVSSLLGADHLVLIKPVSGGTELADPYFQKALADGLRCDVVGAGEIERLPTLLRG